VIYFGERLVHAPAADGAAATLAQTVLCSLLDRAAGRAARRHPAAAAARHRDGATSGLDAAAAAARQRDAAARRAAVVGPDAVVRTPRAQARPELGRRGRQRPAPVPHLFRGGGDGRARRRLRARGLRRLPLALARDQGRVPRLRGARLRRHPRRAAPAPPELLRNSSGRLRGPVVTVLCFHRRPSYLASPRSVHPDAHIT